jgi:hypothetical protein
VTLQLTLPLSPLSLTLTQVTLVDVETGGIVRELTPQGHVASVTSVAVYEELVGGEMRTRVAAGGLGIWVYDEETGARVRWLPNCGTPVTSMVTYRPLPQEGEGGEGGVVWYWGTPTGRFASGRPS